MKRRRNLLVVLLLVCAMGIGVGYAAITDNLTVNGTAPIEQQAFAVKFSDASDSTAVVNENAGASTAPVITLTTKPTDAAPLQSVTATVNNLIDKDDSVSIVLTIKNYNQCTMYLGTPVIKYGAGYTENTDEYFTVAVTGPVNTELASEATTTITVKVTKTDKIWVGAADSTDPYNGQFQITIPSSSVAFS